MKISLIQRPIEWLNPAANRLEAEECIAHSQGVSLCLLSEMFSTGFSMSPEECCVECTQTLEWMVSMAKKYHTAIGGGVAVEREGEYYNRFYIVEKSGKIHHYDKRHLFTLTGEETVYKAGEERVIINLEGVRILLQICYDLRFPVWSRNRSDYDVALYIAAWPESRRAAWNTLLRARAIENVCYVGGVNIVGSDPKCNYSGGSAAIDFMGNTIDSVEDNTSGVATLEVDITALNNFRDKFPALNDRDNFKIK